MEIITAFGFACIATMAFAVLFQAPKKIVLIDGVIGAIGWVVFIYLRHELGYTSFVSNFCATISLALASEFSSRIFKQPVTVFVIPGIVPLVPGLVRFKFDMTEIQPLLIMNIITELPFCLRQ